MNQPTLFNQPNDVTCPTCGGRGSVPADMPIGDTRTRTRRSAQPTAVEAADRLDIATCRRHHVRVLGLLADYETGLTHEQIADRYNDRYAAADRRATSASTLRARTSELLYAEPTAMIEDSGDRRPKSDTGRPSIVWRITPFGRQAFAAGKDAE